MLQHQCMSPWALLVHLRTMPYAVARAEIRPQMLESRRLISTPT